MSASTRNLGILNITYRIAPSDQVILEEWIGRLRAIATTSPGFLGAGVDSVVEGDASRVVTSYKFAEPGDIDDLLASAAWTSAQQDAPSQLIGVPVESRSARESVGRRSEVITATVPPSQREAYQVSRAALDAAASTFPGFVSVDVFEPESGGMDWTTMVTFDSEQTLQAWRDSDQRKDLVARIRQIASDENRVIPTGFGQWFSVNAVAQAQAPAWKQAMTVTAVLYAMVSVLNITLGNLVGQGFDFQGQELVPGLGLPFPVVVFIGNAVGTIILTWVLMPLVTRTVAWWLDPGCTPSRTWLGVALMLGIYAIEMIVFTWVFATFAI